MNAGRPAANETIARPLSGEVIPSTDRQARLQQACGDIVDAEQEPVGIGPKPRPPPRTTTQRRTLSQGLSGLVSAETSGHLSSPGGAAFWTIGIGLVGAAFWLSGGHALVDTASLLLPEAAAEIRVLKVTSRVDAIGGRAYLFVDGETVNDGAAAGSAPPLEISVVAGDGAVTRYRLAESIGRVAAGAGTAFSSRLDLPKNGVKAVMVTVAR